MRKTATLACLALVAAGTIAATAWDTASPPAESWEIGPVIRSRNHSVGMPPHPTPAGRGWSFDFPYPDAGAGHVHYVTFEHGSLAGKSQIVLRYRIDAGPDVRFVPRETPHLPGVVSLFFQRRGDSWSGKGRYEFYRWYAPHATVRHLARGEHEMTVRLDDSWISVQGRPPDTDPAAFADARADASRIGIVFGSEVARGHGVFTTAPARFTLISFRVL